MDPCKRMSTSDQDQHSLIWHFFPAIEFPNTSDRWQRLCDATVRNPLLSSDFVGTALRHFGDGGEIICLAEGPHGPLAGAVLVRKSWATWETFQPSQMPLGAWLQPVSAEIGDVAQSLLKSLPGPALLLSVTHIDSALYRRDPAANRCMTVDAIVTGRVEMAPDMETFMTTGSVRDNPKLTAELMRRMRKAERTYGQIRTTVETEPEAAAEFVDAYAAIESKSWKAKGGSALQPGDEQTRFYADLMRQFGRRNAARMYTVWFGDQAVARQIAVTDGNMLVLLKTTYQPEFRGFGPGVIQMHQVVKYEYDSGRPCRLMELYGSFNDSQKLWVSSTRLIYHANFYRFGFLAGLHGRLRRLRRETSLAAQEEP